MSPPSFYISLSYGERLGQVIAFFLIVSNSVLMPTIATAWRAGSLSLISKRVKSIVTYSSICAMVTGVFILFFWSTFFNFIGAVNSPGIAIYGPIVIVQIYNVLTGSSNPTLNMTDGREWLLSSIAIGIFLQSIILLIWFNYWGDFTFVIAYCSYIVIQKSISFFGARRYWKV